MSAVGTTLLQSPGCNEGKARYETLGKQRIQKLRAPQERHLQGSSTSSQSIYFIILMRFSFLAFYSASALFFVYIGRNALGILKFYYAKSCIY